MQIKLTSDLNRFRRKIDRIYRRQIPFATSQALNDTAFLIRNDTVNKLWPRSVKVKQRGFARAAFRVSKATKHNLESSVFDRLDRAAIRRQIVGGTKLPYSSTHLAIPTWWAKSLNTGRILPSARLSNPKIFKARIGRSNPGLWLRTRKGLKLMYTLEPRAQVDKSFPFYEFGIRTTQLRFERFWDKRMRRAIQTAR